MPWCHSLGDTVHEQTTHAVVAVVDSDGVARLVELVSAGETGRSRADDGDPLARAEGWRVWCHPPHLERLEPLSAVSQ